MADICARECRDRDGLDEHRIYGRRQPFHGTVDVAETGVRVVAAASHRVYNAEFLGLLKTVALDLSRLDAEVYARQIRGLANVSRGEADIPWARAWRDDLRWNLGTCWNDNGRQHGLSNLAELK